MLLSYIYAISQQSLPCVLEIEDPNKFYHFLPDQEIPFLIETE